MKYAVGYQLRDEGESMVDIVRDYQRDISEVYFAWPGVASGRSPLPLDVCERITKELTEIRGMRIRLNLVLNASCYGGVAFSKHLANQIERLAEDIEATIGLDVVTTMSPMIARVIKKFNSDIQLRASINMRLGTIRAFEQTANLFDSYNIQREYNRDLARLGELKGWADRCGKSIHLLANSGCLPWCAIQTFHDNLVSHEHEIDHGDCYARHIPGSCWEYFAKKENRKMFLDGTWIRPEDVKHYEPFVGEMKLATRMHDNPRRVIKAYARQRFSGNLPELLEPGHGRLLTPYVIDNRAFPDDWFEKITQISDQVDRDRYFSETITRVMRDTQENITLFA